MANYSFIEKFLHQLALDNSFIKKSLYDLEKIIYLKKTDLNNVSLDKHILFQAYLDQELQNFKYVLQY